MGCGGCSWAEGGEGAQGGGRVGGCGGWSWAEGALGAGGVVVAAGQRVGTIGVWWLELSRGSIGSWGCGSCSWAEGRHYRCVVVGAEQREHWELGE